MRSWGLPCLVVFLFGGNPRIKTPQVEHLFKTGVARSDGVGRSTQQLKLQVARISSTELHMILMGSDKNRSTRYETSHHNVAKTK